ncbi:CUB domain-containing protein 1 isoform X2 [Melanotaenia boesemani]|uniref:CUB domain-containing protein 1 isoform X2 n=1 Tax=Melanotaenia boesemani TaxID=1250792 RepID=UPI001C03D4A7|nr:CUB domain-containing protein 1 isoform X2 [Melanotaenia boesemani]
MVFVVNLRVCATCALLELIFLAALDTSECLQTAVRPDKGSVVTVSTELPLAQCAVCTISGVNDTQTSCSSSVSLVPEVEVKLLFNCSKPIDQSYTVIITRSIECTKDACNPETEQMSSSILTEFTRNFVWEVKAPEKTAVTLTIYGDELIETSQPCSDGFQYSVAPSKTKNPTQYCRGGTMNQLHLANQGVLSLRVKPKPGSVSVLFKATAGPLKGQKMVVTISPSTTVVLSRDLQESECEACTGDGSSPDCSSTEKTLTSAEKLPVEFSCLRPQDDYSVKIKKAIECTQSSCSFATAEVDPSLFEGFKRILTWDISVPENTVLTLDFPADGLKGISTSENCKNALQYTVSTAKSDGKIGTNSYCKGGTVSHLKLHGATTVTVEVPKGVSVDQTVFSVKAAPRGSRMISVTPDPNTIVIISRVVEGPVCSVCVMEGSEQKCDPQVQQLTDPRNTSVEFKCPQPQNVYSVEINTDCKETICSGNIVQAENMFFPDFNRTFTWDLKVASPRTFQLDFPEPGMRQIPNEETCPDSHTYSLVNYLRSGPVVIGTFCKGGSVTTIVVRFKGRMSLQVPGGEKLDPVDFKISVGPESGTVVKVKLPRGVSETNFITPNYPRDFPDMQQMRWNFTVPGMHNYTMRFLRHTNPECLKDDVVVKYEKENDKVTQLTLSDPQPQHQQGNFNMVLKNCETNTTLQGLSLSYRVSVMRSGHPVLCTVDLTKLQGVSLQIEKVGSDPFCEMSIDSKVTEKIHVAAGTKASLSFLDCPNDDVRLTASKVIECQNVMTCPPTTLTVPTLDSCLPIPLHSFRWNVSIPLDGTVDLVSPTGSLQQILPGQECNQSFSLHVAEDDGFSVGDFCWNGMIQKVQVHSNVSITATAQDFKKTSGPFLNVSFSQEISETVIYRVDPSMTSPTLLATPNWPLGMKSLSTVSWIVSVPSQYQAQLVFVNISLPRCEDIHTSLTVKMLGYEEELMSRREDEEMENNLLVPHSFYLNMSNCIPEERHFGIVTKIVLQRKSNLLAIILGLVGALLLLLIVLAVVCCIRKRKKTKTNKESSIYMGKDNIFRPGDRHFTKTRSDNESHVYEYIDDTMVYGHLLSGSTCSDSMQDNYKGMPTDSYQTFMGPTDGAMPAIKEPDPEPKVDHYKTFLDPSDTFIPPRPRTPIGRQDSLGFQDRRMVDNELYTFKSTGDINMIQLSGANHESQETLSDEFL